MENESKFTFTKEQYRIYQDLLRQTSFQRLISNYFFITINLIIILIGYLSTPVIFENFIIFLFISLIGIFLCIYWSQELREFYILNEVRFRTLMKMESVLIEHGALNMEWESLGEFKFRRSPIFFISLARYLPFAFILIHVGIVLLFYQKYFLSI